MKKITINEIENKFPRFTPYESKLPPKNIELWIKNNPYLPKKKKLKLAKNSSRPISATGTPKKKKQMTKKTATANTSNPTTLDSTLQRTNAFKISNFMKNPLSERFIKKSVSQEELTFSKLKSIAAKTFSSSLSNSFEQLAGSSNFRENYNVMSQLLMEMKEKGKDQTQKEIQKKQSQAVVLKENISDLKATIRGYQVKKQKYNYENCKLVRMIGLLNESNKRYLEEGEKIETLVKQINVLLDQVEIIKQENQVAYEEVYKEKENLKTLQDYIGKINYQISVFQKEKEYLAQEINLWRNQNKTLQNKITETIKFDNNFVVNVVDAYNQLNFKE